MVTSGLSWCTLTVSICLFIVREEVEELRTWHVILFLCLHRKILKTTHDTGTMYDYYIGICTNPEPILVKDADCMVIQKATGTNVSNPIQCLGRKSLAQLTDTLSKCLHVCCNLHSFKTVQQCGSWSTYWQRKRDGGRERGREFAERVLAYFWCNIAIK